MKKIVIAGGTGFLGKALENFFTEKGQKVFILSRNPKRENERHWDAKSQGSWIDLLEGSDILINLTGKCVDCRYTAKNKAEILSSRLDSTRVLNEVIQELENPPKVWLNASSATIYVHAESQKMTESQGVIGDDFSMNICKKWEVEFYANELPSTRRVAMRISIVFGKTGGAYPKLSQITKLGLGGHQGSGEQMVSWIHIDDFCDAVQFIIDNDHLEQSINITSPNSLPNNSLMQKMRAKTGALFGINQPVALLELGALLIRTETELLLKSRNVHPERLLENGFTFQYEKMEEVLADF